MEHGFLADLLGPDRVTTAAGARAAHATDWGTEERNGSEPAVVGF